MEGFAAELAVVLLTVSCDVALKLHLSAKGLTTEDALVHLALVFQVVVFHVELQVSLVAEVPVAGRAPVDLLFITVLHSQVQLNGDFGVKNFLAEGAAEENKSVHIQQVFLKVIH